MTAPDAPPETVAVLFFAYGMYAAVDWLYSKVPVRFPNLKIALSEGGIGWVAGLIDRLDHCFAYQLGYLPTWRDVDLTPSEVLRRNFWFCAIDDTSGFLTRDVIGVDHLLVESDYPHADSTWPDTQAATAPAAGRRPRRRRAPHLLAERRRAVPHAHPTGGPPVTRRSITLAVAAVLATSLLVATPAAAHDGHGRPGALLPLHVAHGKRIAIIDSAGRQVTLRGVNLNSLGDYYQDDPALPPVVPVTGADWDRMAAHGFNVVRLLVSWSRLEPQPGRIDGGYLALIKRTVRDASRRGIYSVIDMHQDAWGKYIASPPGTTCPAGQSPAIGWDGAPRWATLTDGASTCTPGSREDSEAVLTAWDSFYADRDQVMTHLVRVWGEIGRTFAREPAVAGFDLLNEPNHGHRTDFAERLGEYFGRAIDAIRAGERAGNGFSHPAFFETTVYGVPVPVGFTADRNVVFEGHNYGESIGDLPIEGVFEYFQALATQYAAPLWIGEYGWFSDPPAQRSKLVRYSAKEDALLTAGDAWWQWRQACGDPHSIAQPGGTPDRGAGALPAQRLPGRPQPRGGARVVVHVAGLPPGRRRSPPPTDQRVRRSGRVRRVDPAPGDGRGVVPRYGPADRHGDQHRTGRHASGTRRLDRALHRQRDVLGARRGVTTTLSRIVAARATTDPDGVAFAGAGARTWQRVLARRGRSRRHARGAVPGTGQPRSRRSCPTAVTSTCCTSPPSGRGSSRWASGPGPVGARSTISWRAPVRRRCSPSCPNRATRRRSTRPVRSAPTSCGS